jgi:MoaA/NifB/PqqE/SkfB family radical SAM enzyme
MTAMGSELRPPRVRIDACTRCQLSCPVCPTAQGANRKGPVGWGYLRALDFSEFLTRHPFVRHVELSSWGEIFLNPELAAVLDAAHVHGVTVSASGGVNFNQVSDEVLESMVRCGFSHLDVSIDGATGHVYQQYRVGGDLARVLGNIRRLNALKRRHGARLPELTWKFIAFGHNEHEIEDARRLATELGMEFRVCLNFSEIWGSAGYSPIRDASRTAAAAGLPAISLADWRRKLGQPYLMPCRQLWDSPQLNFDGELLGCCHNTTHGFGNAFRDGLEAVLSGKAYRAMQAALLAGGPFSTELPCRGCALAPEAAQAE